MPIYEYSCDACHHRFEKLMRQQQASVSCPKCGQPAQRQVSAAAALGEVTGGCQPAGGFG